MTTDPTDPTELAAFREGAALCRPELRFLVAATGADVLGWLERLASAPVKDIVPAAVVPSTLMDGKGKLRADLRVIAPGDPSQGLLLDLPTSHREALLRLLDMYVIQDDVHLEDASERTECVHLAGPRAAELLAAVGWAPPADSRTATGSAGAGGPVPEGPEGVLVVTSATCGDEAFDLLASREADVARPLRDAGAVEVSVEALDVVRLRRGVPWFGPDLSDGVIPLEALLDESVSITKGCYPGQEVVARIRNLGQVARKLVRLEGESGPPPAPGTELVGTGERDGKPAGVLTSACTDPENGHVLGLGYARRAAWKDGTLLRADGCELVVHSLAGD